MKIYNKLVRDNIPEIMIKNGAKPVTRILSDDEYLIELSVETEGINPYALYDVETNQFVKMFEYDNLIRFNIPKDKLGKWKLDCRENDIENLILDYQVRFVGGDLTKEQVNIEELIIK